MSSSLSHSLEQLCRRCYHPHTSPWTAFPWLCTVLRLKIPHGQHHHHPRGRFPVSPDCNTSASFHHPVSYGCLLSNIRILVFWMETVQICLFLGSWVLALVKSIFAIHEFFSCLFPILANPILWLLTLYLTFPVQITVWFLYPNWSLTNITVLAIAIGLFIEMKGANCKAQ